MTSPHIRIEFLCVACFEEWEEDWEHGSDVLCPKCGTLYETVWRLNAAGNLIGPWLGKAIDGPAPANPPS